MNNSQKELPNQVGYIIKYKDTVENVELTTQQIHRRRQLPPVTGMFTRAFKGFSVPMVFESRMEKLLAEESAHIESYEPDYEVEAFAQQVPWGIANVGAPQSSIAAIDNTGGNNGVHIFVLDTGVSPHPDLNVVEAISLLQRESTALDMNGHGTGVAGVAAARDNTIGVVGMAPGSPIHSYKCLDAKGSGAFSTIIAAVEKVIAWKIANPTLPAVVNMSLGAYVGTFAQNSLDQAVAKLINTYGVPVIVAAGNSGDMADLYSPAHVPEAITVGAYDSANKMTSWSNYGAVLDILAPGANILTTGYSPKTRKYTYVTYNGTSFSAPHVAGAAALYLTATPNASPDAIRTALRALARSDAVSVSLPSTTNLALNVAMISAP